MGLYFDSQYADLDRHFKELRQRRRNGNPAKVKGLKRSINECMDRIHVLDNANHVLQMDNGLLVVRGDNLQKKVDELEVLANSAQHELTLLQSTHAISTRDYNQLVVMYQHLSSYLQFYAGASRDLATIVHTFARSNAAHFLVAIDTDLDKARTHLCEMAWGNLDSANEVRAQAIEDLDCLSSVVDAAIQSTKVIQKFDTRVGNPSEFAARFAPHSGMYAWDLANGPDSTLRRVVDNLPPFLTGIPSSKALGKRVRFEDDEISVSEDDNLEYPTIFESPEYQPYSPVLSVVSIQSSASDVYEIFSDRV